MKIYKAFVKDKNTGRQMFIESEYQSKAQFIKDLRANGYKVNPAKVKDKTTFDYILKNTNCSIADYQRF